MSSKLKNAINTSKQNYQVPSQDGRFISATPQSLCLKFKPPTIAVVYTMSVQGAPTAKQVPANKKFVHNIRVDFGGNSKVDLDRIGTDLISKESVYLNPQFISKQQVISLLKKLYDKEFAGGNKENQNSDKLKQEQKPASNLKLDNKLKDSDDFSDFDKPSNNINNNFGKLDQAEESDEWDFAKEESASKNNSKALNKKSPDKQSAALNLNTDRDLESEGGFNLDELPTDQFNNEPDKFNKVMSTNNHGGLLASIGLKNADGAEGEDDDEDNYADDFDDDFADHNDDPMDLQKDSKKPIVESMQVPLNGKKDIFDTSGTRDQAKKRDLDNDSEIGGDNYDFDIQQSDDEDDQLKLKDPLSSNKKQNHNDISQQQDDQMSPEEEQKAIEEQFQVLYDGDEELRKALANQDVSKLSHDEKYSIIEAYMAQNGASGLQFEIEDEDGEEEEIDAEVIEQKFEQFLEQNPQIREMLDVEQLGIEEKYKILTEGLQAFDEEDDDNETFEYEGKLYRKVQIQGQEGEFLMDNEENIYDMDLNKLGNAHDSDGEDDAVSDGHPKKNR